MLKQGTETDFPLLVSLLENLQKMLTKMDDTTGDTEKASQSSSYSKFMPMNLDEKPIMVLGDPKYSKEFAMKSNLYKKSDIFASLKNITGEGLLFTEGDVWKKHRKLISCCFHFEFLKNNVEIVQNTAREFFDKLTPNDYVNYSVRKIQEITGEIMGRIFFGENLNTYHFEGKPVTLALVGIMNDFSQLIKGPLDEKALNTTIIPKYSEILTKVQAFREVCLKIISDRKNNSDESKQSKHNLIESLLEAQKHQGPEVSLSDSEIIDEFIGFFFAGTNTTGHLVGMMLYFLTQHPQYLQKLKEERKQTYNKEPGVTCDIINKMDVLFSFMKETLRLYNPNRISMFREAIADHVLADINVKEGDLIALDFSASSLDKKYFDEPEKFNPERWRDNPTKSDPYAFLPFSAGPRNCIGQHLAIIEAKVIVSEFLERFDFKLKDGYKLKMIMRLLYEPEEELQFKLSPKTS